MNRHRMTHILYWGVVILIFVVAAEGYLSAGEDFASSFYYSLQLFVLEYSAPEEANLSIYICRILAPVMTATGLFSVLKGIFRSFADGFVSRMQDATAVYYEEDEVRDLMKGFRRVVMAGKTVNPDVKAHILMLPTDIDNLTFYAQMKDKIRSDSKVYIKLEEMDSLLLEKTTVCYFNIYEMIARQYWKERNLAGYLKPDGMNIKIAVIGFGPLGEKILDYGLMNNIYSINQSISYHVWGDSRTYEKLFYDFDPMNGDEIVYHKDDWKDELELFASFDRIIIAEEPEIELLETLLQYNTGVEIDFYNPTGTLLADVYAEDQLTSFGEHAQILTEENIKTDKLYRLAKKLNYSYLVKETDNDDYNWDRPDVEEVMEAEWEKLSGFYKGSNLACADYQEIRNLVLDAMGIAKESISEEQFEELSELEHIRWSRYYYVNHWHKADVKDSSRRLHPLLVPYVELSEGEKQKDRNNIITIQSNAESD